MLVHLQIRDFAIIDSVELELDGGLTALTGETGAGKSIVVDAVMLAMGGRASAEMLRHGTERAEITATFDISGNKAARSWLEGQSLDAGTDEIVLRRVINADGRSRQYVNGQTQPAQLVRELGDLLIDIHGQQEFLSLVRRDSQRQLVDQHGGHESLLQPVQAQAESWRKLAQQRDALLAAAAERGSRLELLRYQVGELDALALATGEVGELAEEQARLANRGKLAEGAQQAMALAYDADGADAHAIAARAAGHLRGAASIDSRLAAPLRLLEESVITLQEAGAALGGYLESLDMDPARQEQVERRMAAIEDLARKHRVAAGDLPALGEQLRQELLELERSELTLGNLDQSLAGIRADYQVAANALGQARRKAGKSLASAVSTLMKQLGMPGGRFEVAIEPLENTDPHAQGLERVEFLVSANPGQPVRAVGKVASGGELSRISLAVQVAVANRQDQGCMIFDEVDAGVGGGVAEIVGRQLRALGDRGQVLCVTHLAQVASQAHHQVRVSKLTDGKTSRTVLAHLVEAERVEELARMLGGVEITRKARDHAREMLRVAAAS